MKHRRTFAFITAMLLISNLTLGVLAADWDLEQQGSLYIDTDTDYTVIATDGNGNAVITSNTIYIESGVTTTITLDNVHINAYDEEGIFAAGDSDVTLNLVGDNSVHATSDDGASAIRVMKGNLTITSQTGGSLGAINFADYGYNHSAAIGSNEGQDLSGNITITGNATVFAHSDENGAGIGSGMNGSMTGSITISGDAKVEATSGNNGAGIGSGEFYYESYVYDDATDSYIYYDENDRKVEENAMSGSITIGGNAQVIAESDDDGAGIGSGEDSRMTGSITIGGNAQVWAESEDRGAGIGSGENEDMDGSITIGGNASVTALSDDDSAGIGAGQDGDIGAKAAITIKDNAQVLAIGDTEGTGIGSGEGEEMRGTITISGNASVTAIGGSDGAAIGAEDSGDMEGTIRILDNAQVTTGVSADDDAHCERTGDDTFTTPDILYSVDPDSIGIIGGGNSADSSTDGHYVISPTATINGIAGSDIENLAQYVEFAEDLSNLTIVYDGKNCRVIWNEDRDISAFVSEASAITALTESALKDTKLTDGVGKDKILAACHLAFDKAHTGSAFLRFHLGEELAGKAVEIRFFENGQIVSRTVTVSASGIAVIEAAIPGDFAVIAK